LCLSVVLTDVRQHGDQYRLVHINCLPAAWRPARTGSDSIIMSSTAICHHYREHRADGVLKVVCTLCGKTLPRNAGVMTMHHRMVHNSVASLTSSDYFQEKQVDGVLMAVCALCGRALRRNAGMMSIHFRMVHCLLSDASHHVCRLQNVSPPAGAGLGVANTTGISNASASDDTSTSNMHDTLPLKLPPHAAERQHLIDALAQRCRDACTDPEVRRSILDNVSPSARHILTRWLSQLQFH
jgi:hypothetical protein